LQFSNQILEMLPSSEMKMVAKSSEIVDLPLREILCEAGQPLKHVYFPLSNMISALLVLEDETPVEVATIGNEGMAGLGVLMGPRERSLYRLVQQVNGECLRVPADELHRVLKEAKVLRNLLVRYALGLGRQSAQNAACNLFHNVEKRMARWLLTSADRTGRDEFVLTQEFLSQMLGVRRQTVNATAGDLQALGMIAYRWGRLQILDRPALEDIACECYGVNRGIYAQVMRKGA
jgi:CRP-like cAMP-binding protein